jgi:hypothetical protein
LSEEAKRKQKVHSLAITFSGDGSVHRAFCSYSLDYRRSVEPGLSEADAAWAQERLAAKASSGPEI